MALSAEGFSNDAPALWYGPRAHTRPGPRSQRLWLLWPAWAWRVMVPEPGVQALNVLQRVALALATAGLRTSDEIGRRMQIHPDLAQLVLTELFQLKLLDGQGRPTARGVGELDDARSRPVTAAWVFQDPFTGELWPRAEARLNYVERSFDADGWPKLSLGEPGRPWLQRAFLVQPGRVARPAPPAPAEILRAARSHRRMRRRLAREEEALIGDEGVPGVEDDDVRAGGVSFVEERPQAMWLVAYAYVPQGEEDRRWYITDPFGLGPSERLRGWVERERTRSKPLGAELLRFLHGRGEEAAGDASEVAKLTLDQRHGIAVRSHPAFEALVEVETVLGSGTLSAWMARAAYAALRRALEVLFGPLARRAPWRDLSGQDAVFNRQHLDACAVQVGLAPLPNAVLKVRQGQVRSAAEFNGGSLRARVAAAVLAAARSSDHRLRSAAGRDPRVLERVEALAVAAGDAVHASGFRLDRDRLKADVEELHALVGALGLGDNGRQEGW